jgi:hypothetical protein
LITTTACAAAGGVLYWSLHSAAFGADKPLHSGGWWDPENRLLVVVLGLLGLLVTWVIPGVLYAPLVPVSIPRSMFISVVQVLLRIFLYVLIAAVVMVVLAILQIARGSDARSDLWAPALTHLLAIVFP